MKHAKSRKKVTASGRTGLVIAIQAALALGVVIQAQAAGFPATINLGTLNGTDGFRLDGAASVDFSGGSVSAAGDLNGDGIGDVIIGAPDADPNGSNSGSSYVVFGSSAGFSSSLQLSTLGGSNGFRLDGAAGNDRSGGSVSAAGDVNGDGIDDVIIGAPDADPNGSNSGSSYVVFGSSAGFASFLALSALDGSNGFRLDGAAAYDFSGHSVSAAGDVNGDGIGDVIIGAYEASPNGNSYSGSSYVVFGSSAGFASSLALSGLDGSNGFRLDGVVAGDHSGRSVSAAGDVNGDGIRDVIIGADGADLNGSNSGSSYVVFGASTGFASSLQLSALGGTDGFRLDGAAGSDWSGHSVGAAGDLNGDGISDVIIGAYGGTPNGTSSGSSYVVFGSSAGFAPSLALSALDGSNGFRLDGAAAFDYSGRSVSAAGDINGDGIGDVIVGASGADPNGSLSGSSYVVFGVAPVPTALQNGVVVSGLTGLASSNQFFSLQVPASASNLVFQTSPGPIVRGDSDLYVRFGLTPTTGSYDCRHFQGGNAETCSIPTTKPGTYYVMLHGFTAFSDVSLVGSFTLHNAPFDFDADTHADILWRHRVTGNNALWLMNGRTANKGPINPVAQAAQKIQGVGDFDGDGKSDIFWRNTAIGTNSIWLMNGRTPSFGATQTVANLSFNVAGIGDFDGDGKGDVLWRNASTGANSIWLMNGRTPSTGPINATATAWSVGGVGDFNGDGKADILWRNSVNGRNSIWLMNGRTISFGATSQVTNLNIVVSGIGDFDGDGKADILWRNNVNGVNPLWLMNGRTPSFGTTSQVANLDLTVVLTSDFDGDGKADILWRNLTTGDNSLWLMNGRTASFGATSPVADLNWEVVP